MRWVKFYLRSIMTQERRNHLILLHIYKGIIDSIQLSDVAIEFVGDSEHGQRIGKVFIFVAIIYNYSIICNTQLMHIK